MKKKLQFTTLILMCLSLLIVAPETNAQEVAGRSGRNMKRNVATILFSSLGGAVLGLSTLSFYGNPQEHTNNITTGALVGFVAGLGYVAYSTTQPKTQSYEYSLEFGDGKHRRGLQGLAQASHPALRFDFEF